jgi:hypothetical protein
VSGIDPITDLVLMMTSYVKTIKIIQKLVEKIALNNKNLTKLPL